MRSPNAPKSVIAPISVEKRVTKSRRSVEEAGGEAISVGRTLIDRTRRSYAGCSPTQGFATAVNAFAVQSCTARQYTPGYRMELEEFRFPTTATKACPSKMGRIRNEVIPH